MKRIVRLTESDLTRIVRRVIEEEQINEKFNMKNLLPALAIIASLNLSSCKSKEDVTEKIPMIEKVIENQISNMNEYRDKGDTIMLDKIVEIKGPYKPCKDCDPQFFIVSKIQEIEGTSIKHEYMILVYQEMKNKGVIIGQMNVDSKSEVNHQVDHFRKKQTWDRSEDM
jgi:hypothetical protein